MRHTPDLENLSSVDKSLEKL